VDRAGTAQRTTFLEVPINTDDQMIFGQSVSEEYPNLYNAGVFTAQELEGIRAASIA